MAQNYQPPKWMVFLLNMIISVGHWYHNFEPNPFGDGWIWENQAQEVNQRTLRFQNFTFIESTPDDLTITGGSQ